MSESVNKFMSNKAICRTALATPGLLPMEKLLQIHTHSRLHTQTYTQKLRLICSNPYFFRVRANQEATLNKCLTALGNPWELCVQHSWPPFLPPSSTCTLG